MNKQDIIKIVGLEIYYREGDAAYKAAPYTGSSSAPMTYRSSIPIQINDLIWYNETAHTSDKEKIATMFDVYRDIPCYALLTEAVMHFDNQLLDDTKAMFWQQSHYFLSQENDSLAEPIAYMLWCDFFELPDRCEIAWDNLMTHPTNNNFLRRILKISGPVPFQLKDILYKMLIKDNQWHNDIFYSLLYSSFDAYG